MNKFLTTVLVSMVVVSVVAEGNAWRVSVGGRARFGIDSSLRANGRAASALMSTPARVNFAEKYAAATTPDKDGTYNFDNGFFNPVDSANNGQTRNWQVTTGSQDLTSDSIVFSSEYLAVVPGELATPSSVGSDDEDAFGASIELARTLWRTDNWGIDLSLGLSWFEDVNILKSSGVVRSQTTQTGTIQASVALGNGTTVGDLPEFVNGYYGVGQPGLSYGTLLDKANFSPTVIPGTATTTELWLHAKGEMSMLEAQLALQPWMRVWNSLYLRGKIGVAAIATDISISGSAAETGAGTIWNGSEDTQDVIFAGIFGLSAEYYFTDNLFISAGVEYLLGAEDVEVKSDFVTGDVSVGDFGATIALGWAF